MVFCGDLNVYDNDARRHYFTLMTGDILDEKTYGADFLPIGTTPLWATPSPCTMPAGGPLHLAQRHHAL